MTELPLVDAIFGMASASEAAVICAKEPFSWGAKSVIVELTDDFRVPEAVLQQGYTYFLGKEDVLDLLEQVEMKRASRETKAEFVSHYAMFDAYPRWIEDVPDQ